MYTKIKLCINKNNYQTLHVHEHKHVLNFPTLKKTHIMTKCCILQCNCVTARNARLDRTVESHTQQLPTICFMRLFFCLITHFLCQLHVLHISFSGARSKSTFVDSKKCALSVF